MASEKRTEAFSASDEFLLSLEQPEDAQAELSSDGRRRTPKISERVALDIAHDIVIQGLQAGDPLPLKAAMVRKYGVSGASVREALRLLEVQGLIRVKPGGGPVVGTVEASHLARTATLFFHLGGASYHDLLQTQVLMEPLCAQLAAVHPYRRDAMEPFFAPSSVEPETVYRAAAFDFHSTVYALTANPVLRLLTEAVSHILADHAVATMDPVELRPVIVEEHAVLAHAIADGDSEEAFRVTIEHFESQHDYYRRRWPARLDELIEWR